MSRWEFKPHWVMLFARSTFLKEHGHHGYVILAVHCNEAEQIQRVREKIDGKFFYVENNEWYSGPFDHIGTIASVGEPDIYNNQGTTRLVNSYGDNRMFRIYTAEEILR